MPSGHKSTPRRGENASPAPTSPPSSHFRQAGGEATSSTSRLAAPGSGNSQSLANNQTASALLLLSGNAQQQSGVPTSQFTQASSLSWPQPSSQLTSTQSTTASSFSLPTPPMPNPNVAGIGIVPPFPTHNVANLGPWPWMASTQHQQQQYARLSTFVSPPMMPSQPILPMQVNSMPPILAQAHARLQAFSQPFVGISDQQPPIDSNDSMGGAMPSVWRSQVHFPGILPQFPFPQSVGAGHPLISHTPTQFAPYLLPSTSSSTSVTSSSSFAGDSTTNTATSSFPASHQSPKARIMPPFPTSLNVGHGQNETNNNATKVSSKDDDNESSISSLVQAYSHDTSNSPRPRPSSAGSRYLVAHDTQSSTSVAERSGIEETTSSTVNVQAPAVIRAQRIGRWTALEHKRFLEAVERYGFGQWRPITAHIGSRSSLQVRSHAQKWLRSRAKNRTISTLADDEEEDYEEEGDDEDEEGTLGGEGDDGSSEVGGSSVISEGVEPKITGSGGSTFGSGGDGSSGANSILR